MEQDKYHVKYPIIKVAVSGNTEAIEAILNHYSGYINKLSIITVIDEYGYKHQAIDTHLCDILKVHLITAILKFDIKR